MNTIRMQVVRRAASGMLATAALLATALAPAARAADPPVAITAGAGADWGVKASFRNYIKGPIAHGSITVSDGASENADGTFHFPVASGEYDPATSATVVTFAGTVHFTGHAGQLDMIVRSPRVEITPEGSALYADVSSKSLDSGTLVDYPNVHFGDLISAGATPAVADGRTTWPALPTTLTAVAVPAFAGFYSAGTVLDAFSFGYDGPGGRPQLENWTAPGSPLFGGVVNGTVPSGVADLTAAGDQLWMSSYDRRSLTQLDPSDLTVKGSVDVGHNSRNGAVHAATGTAYSIDADVRRVTAVDGALTLDPAPVFAMPGTASNELVVRQSDGALFTLYDNALHRYVPESGGTWAHDSWPITGIHQQLTITDDGRLFLYGAGLAEVRFDEAGEATIAAIDGTEGASNIAVAADGTIYWALLDYSEYPRVTRSLKVMTPRAGGGYTTQTPLVDDRIGSYVSAVEPDGSRLYLADSTTRNVLVIEDGEIVSTVVGPATLNDIVASPAGDVYALWRDGAVAKLGQVGTSPTVTGQPQDVAIELAAGGAPQDVTFTVAATGDPAPGVQWQTRAVGAAAWTDVAGATSATLTVSAVEALSGTRYRAVVSNPAGALPSSPATLMVTVAEGEDPGREDPGTGDPGTGDPGTGDPGTGDPGTSDPGTGNPGTDPGTGSSGNPGTGSGGGTTVQPPATPAGPGTRPTGDDPSTTPAPVTVAPPGGGLQHASRTGVVRVATVACRAGGGACTVTAPKRVRVRIAGRTYVATVVAPKRVKAGARAAVTLRLPKRALARLGSRRVKARVKLTVAAGGQRVTRTAAVTFAAPKAKRTAR